MKRKLVWAIVLLDQTDLSVRLSINLQTPEKDDWTNGLEAVELALQLEKNVNQSLLDLHDIATKNKDPAVIWAPHVRLAKVVPKDILLVFVEYFSF